MKAVLEIGINDLNINLIELLTSLFKQNVTEVVIRKSTINIEEFDKSLKIDDILEKLKNEGHNALLLSDIENGFKNNFIFNKNN